MTFDKYFAITWPHKAMLHSTPKKTKITLAVLLTITLIYNIPHLFITELVGDSQDICLGYSRDGWFPRVFSWISFTFNCIVPFFLLVMMNYKIVQTVRQSKKQFHSKDAQDSVHFINSGGKNTNKTTRISSMR